MFVKHFVFILIKPNHKISAFSSLLYQHIPSQKMSKIDCFDKTFIELSTTDNTLHADRKEMFENRLFDAKSILKGKL